MMPFEPKPGPWQMLPGWFNYADLYSHAVEISKDGDTLVEIGVAFGRSLSYLAREVRESGKSLTIVAVDPFDAIKEVWGAEHADWAMKMGGPRAAFDLLVKRHDPALWDEIQSGKVKLHQDYSVNVAKLIADESCSFVFVDGDHREKAVREDIAAWEPKVRDGGMLTGHDFTPTDPCGVDVVKVVTELYPKAEVWGTSWVQHIVRPKVNGSANITRPSLRAGAFIGANERLP